VVVSVSIFLEVSVVLFLLCEGVVWLWYGVGVVVVGDELGVL